MTSFNRIGATWAGGSYDLITGIVRNEWGFDGWILTDNADTGVFMNGLQMIQAGADAKLTVSDPTALWSFDSGDATQYGYAREAMHHLLYVMANSHVMNGAVHGSVYSTAPPACRRPTCSAGASPAWASWAWASSWASTSPWSSAAAGGADEGTFPLSTSSAGREGRALCFSSVTAVT